MAGHRLLGTTIAALALAGCGESAAPPPPEHGGANLWIDSGGGSCERHAEPAGYTSDEACGSLAVAYAKAETGDEIRVKAGAYPPQDLRRSNPRLTGAVTIRPAKGETVTFASLTTDGDHVTIRNIAIPVGATPRRGWFSTGSDVTLQNVDISGPEATVDITGGTRVTYRDSDFGTPRNTTIRQCATGNGMPFQVSPARDVLIENVDFHPFIADRGPDCGPDGVLHLETIRIGDDVQDMTISRSRFLEGDGSGTARILQTGAGGVDTTGLKIVNTWIGPASKGAIGNSVHLAGGSASCEGFVIAYSYWVGGMNDAMCPTKPAYYGNLGTIPDYADCPGSDAAANLWVWSAPKTDCGTDRWLVDAAMLDAYRHAADGFHLTADSPAVDAGQELAACEELTGGVDIDGEPRAGRCDAGPDELVR